MKKEKDKAFYAFAYVVSFKNNQKIWFWCIHLCFLILKKIKK